MVLAWVSERLAVAMRQAEDRDNVLDKFDLMDLETRQGNKGQGLKRFKMFDFSFKKAFSIKTGAFHTDVLSHCHDFWIKWGMSTEPFLNFVSFPKFYNKFGLSLFENKIRKELGTYVNQSVSLHNPFVYPSFVSRVFLKNRSAMLLRFIKIAKVFFNPIKKLSFCIGYIKNGSVGRILISIIFGGIDSINTNRSLSIYDSGKISKFKRLINNLCIWDFRNIAPCVKPS